MAEYGVISVPYFPAFGLKTGKYGPEIIPYLNTFHAVTIFLIICKAYPVPARRNVFHNRGLVFENEEARLSGKIFFHVIASSWQGRLKWMFLRKRKACKQNRHLQKVFLYGETWLQSK